MSAMGSSSTFSTDPINQDAVVFENVADQYIKGEDVHIEFTILNQQKINVKADRIGLIRVGANAPKDCLIDVPITSDPSGTFHHGQATFPASSLTMTDDEFYQFCYINDQGKILALSIPFQLNCSPDDVDLLSSCSTFVSTNFHPRQGLITLADHDQDDLLVVHTKGMLLEEKLRQENRQLLEQNRRLEELHQQIQVKLDLNDAKFNDYIAKTKNEMQILANTHKTTIDELTARQRVEEKLRAEFEASMELCHQYQSESLRFAERCRALEDAHTELTGEVQRLRAQLSLSNQSIDEQTIQIVELEKSLINSTEALKKADQYQNQLEQQLKDLRATAEKYQKNVQGKLDAFAKQASQQENQIHALESANELLKDELKKVNEEKVFLLNMLEEEKHEKKILQERCRIIQMYQEQAEKEVENMRKEFEESQTREEDNQKLVTAMTEIQKRCVKHQKSEIDAKRQLSAERELVTELKGKIHELTERLTVGAEEYKALYRKYLALQRTVLKNSSTNSKQSPTTLSNETGLNEEALVSLLRNSYELQQQQQNASANQCRAEADASTTDRTAEEEDEEEEEEKTEPITSHQEQEVQECPICYWEFPNHLTLDNKKDHIDGHFD